MDECPSGILNDLRAQINNKLAQTGKVCLQPPVPPSSDGQPTAADESTVC